MASWTFALVASFFVTIRVPCMWAGYEGSRRRQTHRARSDSPSYWKSLNVSGRTSWPSDSTGFLLFPRRRHQNTAPKESHVLRTVRHHGGCLTLSFSGGSAARRAQHRIGAAQPHAHERVLF